MSLKSLAVIQPVPVPTGTSNFEAFKTSILEEFAEKVPQDLRLSPSLIDNPPRDVTAVPRECGILSQEEIDITESYDATSLAAAIKEKKLTAASVAKAFGKRAIIAHQLTCCLMEWFMDEAVQQAEVLDAHLEKTGETVGPLHGVPFSIKEHMPLAGHWTTVGFMDTRRKDTKDCQMMAILRKAGAVFYCKTIQPQSIMHLESVSNYGRVLNPYNINLSAGGSTGGEAALIALRGSILGVGTDIGGSVRGPAAFCGIYGFKPTSYTVPMRDFLVGGFAAELNVLCSAGPMCTSARDMDLFMSVMSDAKPYLTDPRLVPLPWTGLKAAPKPTPLKIGFMWNDGNIQPQPPVTKALDWAYHKLQTSSDFSLKTFEPYNAAQALRNIRLAYWPDGGKTVKDHLAKTGEPLFPLTQWILKDADGTELDSAAVLKQRVVRDQYRIEFAENWESQDVDFVICPVWVGPACAHDTAFYWDYTALWNYVDYPGVVVPTPVKAQKKGSESYASGHDTPLSDQCKHVRQLWEQGDFEGAPINLQVVARKYHDNDLFAALGPILKAFEG